MNAIKPEEKDVSFAELVNRVRTVDKHISMAQAMKQAKEV